MGQVDGAPLADAGRLRVPGRHNVWNLCGAVAGALLLTGPAPSAAAVAAAVDGFAGLPSRCRTVGERDGRTFVDDALASNPFASAASIETFAGRPLTVIVGRGRPGGRPGAPGRGPGRPPPAGRGGGAAARPSGWPRRWSRGAAAGRRSDGAPTWPRPWPWPPALHARAAGWCCSRPGAPTPDGGGGYRERSRQFAAAPAGPRVPTGGGPRRSGVTGRAQGLTASRHRATVREDRGGRGAPDHHHHRPGRAASTPSPTPDGGRSWSTPTDLPEALGGS